MLNYLIRLFKYYVQYYVFFCTKGKKILQFLNKFYNFIINYIYKQKKPKTHFKYFLSSLIFSTMHAHDFNFTPLNIKVEVEQQKQNGVTVQVLYILLVV